MHQHLRGEVHTIKGSTDKYCQALAAFKQGGPTYDALLRGSRD